MAAKDRTWPSQTVQSFPLPLWNGIRERGIASPNATTPPPILLLIAAAHMADLDWSKSDKMTAHTSHWLNLAPY